MPLSLSTAMQAAIAAGRLHMRLLVQFDLTGGASPATYRFTDDDGTISWGGHDWIGAGQIASISAPSFGASTSTGGLVVTVNGAGLATEGDPSGAALLATVLDEARRLDAVSIQRLHYDAGTLEILDVSPYWDGYIARLPLRREPVGEGGMQAVLTMELESDELMLQRSPGRYRSDADQRRMWPVGGGGLHLVVTTAASGQSVFWGQDAPNQNVATSPAPGGGPMARAAGKLLAQM